MRLFLEAADFPMIGDRFNIADASIPPARVGLTESERNVLSEFMTTAGTRNLEAVIEMIGRAVPRGAVTFLRTHDAVAGWLGRWEGAYEYNLHPCKTPILGVVVQRDGRSRVLSPHPVSASCRSKASTTRRADDKLCGSVEGLVTCIGLPPGPPVYVVEWTPRGIAVQGAERSSRPSSGPSASLRSVLRDSP